MGSEGPTQRDQPQISDTMRTCTGQIMLVLHVGCKHGLLDGGARDAEIIWD